MIKQTMCALAAMLASGGLAAGQAVDWRERVTAEELERGEIHLGMIFNETRDGFMRLGWYRDGETLHIWDRTMFASQEIYETYAAQIDASTLAPMSADIDFYTGGRRMRFDVDFNAAAVTGSLTAMTPGQDRQSRPIEMDLPEGTMLRASSFVLVGLLELVPGEFSEFTWYGPLSGLVETVRLTAVGRETITTPAGEFQTVRIEQRGGTPPNDFYVEEETGRVVRIDVGGQPMRFVALPEPGQ